MKRRSEFRRTALSLTMNDLFLPSSTPLPDASMRQRATGSDEEELSEGMTTTVSDDLSEESDDESDSDNDDDDDIFKITNS